MQDDPTVSLISDKIPGFLNSYSTAGVEEDQAEIDANLMVNSAALAERARRDAVIHQKVWAIVALLRAFSDTSHELLRGSTFLPEATLPFVRVSAAGEGRTSTRRRSTRRASAPEPWCAPSASRPCSANSRQSLPRRDSPRRSHCGSATDIRSRVPPGPSTSSQIALPVGNVDGTSMWP